MKNRTFISLLLNVFIVLSLICCKNSVDSKIEKAFKLYGKENLASSNAIREVISISPNDTVSTKELIVMSKDLLSLVDSGMFLNRLSSIDLKYKALQNNTKVPKNLRTQFQDEFNSWYNFFTGNSFQIALSLATLQEAIKTTDTTMLIEYKIKARIKENGVSSVKEYYAIVKNGDYENISIQDHKLTVDELPEATRNIMKAYGDFMDWYAKDTEHCTKLMAILLSCDPYLD